mmetsp:Transcript_9063/g.27212  ORF Transcript_9063/g.27212 Transcript_9063/m.27212 type:complete len:271 (-) Transcript_9063:1160-1972(-)
MRGAQISLAAALALYVAIATAGAESCPKSTHDILRLAGHTPIPAHEEPDFVPQAAKTNQAARRAMQLGKKSVCEGEDWRKGSLKLVREIPIAGVLGALEEETKFEASGIAKGLNNQYYVACDNMRTLPSLNERLQFKSNLSRLVRDETPQSSWSGPLRGPEDSQFEGITYVPKLNHFLVVQELVEHGDHYHPVVQELALAEDGESYTVMQNCTVDFEIGYANKGFEGIQYHEDKDGGMRPILQHSAKLSPLEVSQDHRMWLSTVEHAAVP